MNPQPSLAFPPFRFDPINECLWHGEQQLPLRGKTFAVLRYLLEHPHQLVTKETLFNAVWPDTTVEEGALTICIHELRHALGDDAKTPQFIETMHRRGYRFIAPITTAPPVSGSRFQVSSSQRESRSQQLETWNLKLETPLVGREAEIAQLHKWWDKALSGERQIVFVTGEPGIGKTSLVEAFLSEVRGPKSEVKKRPASKVQGTVFDPTPNTQYPTPSPWIGRGQCVEHYGAGEGYMPMLEALGRLCREPGGEHLIELLGQHAPTWLVQMPALLSAADLEVLQRKVQGATRERMLREMAEAVEALTAERPLVLRLEDLHWSDVSTLDLLSVLARRQEAARLLVLGTYRPVEMLANGHPLRMVKQELQMHRQCEEQRLTFLTEEHVAEYLAKRFEGRARRVVPLQELARTVHQRTEGNPLFIVNIVDYLTTQGGLEESVERVQVGVPGDLRQMIEEQIHRLSSTERRVVEVASVAGAEFSAAAVAAGLGVTVEEVEEPCEGLVRREQFLRAREIAEWPDGTVATHYQFLHALYQEVLYERIPAARRSRLHRLIGERTEAAYGDRADEISAELAVHFERGREHRRAIQYLRQAGENAARRSAHQEAIILLTKGLELLKTLPGTPERAQQELRLQVALGPPLQATKGYAAPEVEYAYARARELCRQIGDTPQLFPVLLGLCTFYMIRAELQAARELAEQCLSLAQRMHSPSRLMWAHQLLGITLFFLGEFALAQDHLEQGSALYDLQKHTPLVSGAVQDPKVSCLSYGAWALWVRGYPDRALQRSREALTLAPELSHPFSLAYTLYHTASLHQCRREGQAAKQRAESSITLSTEQGFTEWVALGTIVQGWALAEQEQGEEGVTQIRQGIAAYQATGSELLRPHFLALLAEAYERVGQAEEGLGALAEALAVVDKTRECSDEAELYRIKGQLVLQSGVRSPKSKVKTSLGQVQNKSKTSQDKSGVTNPQSPTPNPQSEAEACFLKAIEIARKQQAKSWELRATMSLVRLWQQQGKQHEARNTLSEIYGWFTEGFDTADLQEAKALLEELA
jgi:predicted ATPase